MAHVTTELTSKKLKLQLLLSWLFVFGGLGLSAFAAMYTKSVATLVAGFVISIVSAFWLIVTKIRIWWNHG